MQLSKIWAFIIHLNLSILIFSILVATMWFYWFPGDLFFLDGGWQGLKLVAIIDLVLGPALTLLLYKPKKKGLVFDMAAIAIFQISALAYGFYATWQQQTIALVFSEGKFNTLSLAAHKSANDELTKFGETPTFARTLDTGRPATLMVRPPTKVTFGSLIADTLNGYPEPQERSDRFISLEDNHDLLKARSLQPDYLQERGQWEPVEASLNRLGKEPADVELYRFKARYGYGVAIFSPEKMRVIKYVALNGIKRKPVVAKVTDPSDTPTDKKEDRNLETTQAAVEE